MEKLYYQDKYLKEVDSYIEEIIDWGEEKGYIFKETIFFPGGGGQAADKGYIEYIGEDGNKVSAYIKRVEESGDERVVHILDSNQNIFKDTKIREFLDYKSREDSMSQHTGQHILSGCIFNMYNRNTRGLHIGSEVSELDLEGQFDDYMVMKIEEYANEIISREIEIKNYIIPKGEQASIHTRRALPKDAEEIRILDIVGLDINACCGVHHTNTKGVKLIKIKKYYKHKDGTRFEYMAGNRAVAYLLKRDRVFSAVLNKFNCNEENIEGAISNLEVKKDEFYEESKRLSDKYIEILKCDIMKNDHILSDGTHLIKMKFEGENDSILKSLAKKLTEEYRAIVIFANVKEENIFLLLQCSKDRLKSKKFIDLSSHIKCNKDEYEIRGGGSKFSAQGIMPSQKNIDILLDSIYHIYIGN